MRWGLAAPATRARGAVTRAPPRPSAVFSEGGEGTGTGADEGQFLGAGAPGSGSEGQARAL